MNIFDREELSDEMENKTIPHCRKMSKFQSKNHRKRQNPYT